MIKPPALRPGDTIGIMAPSSRVDREAIEQACHWLDNYGFALEIHPQTFAEHYQSAGTHQEKLAAFHGLWNNPKVRLIMSARGGNRSGALLPLLDYPLLSRRSKLLIGYSDMTALLSGIQRRTGLVTFHGPALNSFTNGTEEKHLELAFQVMAGMETELPMWGTQIMRPGKADGRLIGGNLSLICSLMGTRWEPDFKDAILFLEDAGDQLSRYDRMLLQLRNAGVFERVNGVMFGDFSMADDKGAVPFGYHLDEILNDALGNAKIPVVTHAPFGHGVNLVTFPVGVMARLDARASHEVTLKLTESPVEKA